MLVCIISFIFNNTFSCYINIFNKNMEEIVIDSPNVENVENVENLDLSINVVDVNENTSTFTEQSNITITNHIEEFVSSSPINCLTFRNSPSSIKNKYISPKNNKKIIEKLKKHVESEKIECICCYEIGFPSVICAKTCVANPKHQICNRCFTKQKAKRCFYCNPLDDGHKSRTRRESRRRTPYDIASGLEIQNIHRLHDLINDLSNNNVVVINSSPEYRRYRTRNVRAVHPLHYGSQIIIEDADINQYDSRQERFQILLSSMARCCMFLTCAWFLSLLFEYDNANRNSRYNNNTI